MKRILFSLILCMLAMASWAQMQMLYKGQDNRVAIGTTADAGTWKNNPDKAENYRLFTFSADATENLVFYAYFYGPSTAMTGMLFDSDKKALQYSDDSWRDPNCDAVFGLTYTVEAGKTYYLGIRSNDGAEVSSSCHIMIKPYEGNVGINIPQYCRVVRPKVGDGSDPSPLEIGTAGELEWFAQYVNGESGDGQEHPGACARLVSDIDLMFTCGPVKGSWTPIASADKYGFSWGYSGNFYGDGHTISQLYINRTSEKDTIQGFFGRCRWDAFITNLNFTQAYVNAYSKAGILCGGGFDTYVSGITTSGEIIAEHDVAGIGRMLHATDCINYANVTATVGGDASGIASGYQNGIERCVNYGNISGKVTSVGGICHGFFAPYDRTVIRDCANYGKVTMRELKNSLNSGVGGICGYLPTGSIGHCFSYGDVETTHSSDICEDYKFTGMLVGYGNFKVIGFLAFCNEVSYIVDGKTITPEANDCFGNRATFSADFNPYLQFSAEQIASGYMAWKFNEDGRVVWGQTIGEDEKPQPNKPTVHLAALTFTCAGAEYTFSNENVETQYANEHDLMPVKREPTYTEPGERLHYKCQNCSSVFDETMREELLSLETLSIPALIGTAPTYTLLASNSGFDGEGADKALDGITNNKWCGKMGTEHPYLELKSDDRVKILHYHLHTGNDIKNNGFNRNPKTWRLYAKLAIGDEWTLVADVADQDLPLSYSVRTDDYYLDEAYQEQYYQYFRFELLDVNKGQSKWEDSVFEIGEFCLVGELCEHELDGNYICIHCGKKVNPELIKGENTLNIGTTANQETWLKDRSYADYYDLFEYVATATEDLVFYASGTDQDSYGMLFDSEMNIIKECVDDWAARDFALTCTVQEGQTYYLGLRHKDGSKISGCTVVIADNTYGDLGTDLAELAQVTRPAVGDGTVENPFEIWTPGELKWFANYVNSDSGDRTSHRDACAKLMTDIDLSLVCGPRLGNWIPISYKYSTTNYYGTFDGAGHTISNLYINNENGIDQAFIGYCDGHNSATLKDINFANAYINANKSAAILCASGSAAKASRITTRGEVIAKSDASGLGGYINAYDCINYADVTGTEGGLISGIGDGHRNIERCINYGKITGKGAHVGGIAGAATITYLEISDCINYGTVTLTESEGSTTCSAGGICGRSSTTVIRNCINYGNVVTDRAEVAGLIVGTGQIYYTDFVLAHSSNAQIIVNGEVVAPLHMGANVTYRSDMAFYQTFSEAELASGYAAWMMNRNGRGLWGQELGVDTEPGLNRPVVYASSVSLTCEGTVCECSNTETDLLYYRNDHPLGELISKPATQEATGEIPHYECSHCGALFDKDDRQKQLRPSDIVIPMLDPTPVHFTILSSNGGFTNEGPEKAFDGIYNNKWCGSLKTEAAYVELMADEKVKLDYYYFYTGSGIFRDSDNRNPQEWKLYAKANAEDPWIEVVHVTDSKMVDEISTKTGSYYLDEAYREEYYQYFKFELLGVKKYIYTGDPIYEIGEICFIGKPCEHEYDADGMCIHCGVVSAVQRIVSVILGKSDFSTHPDADVDGDGEVRVTDLVKYIQTEGK